MVAVRSVAGTVRAVEVGLRAWQHEALLEVTEAVMAASTGSQRPDCRRGNRSMKARCTVRTTRGTTRT